jgi:antitoxin Phd
MKTWLVKDARARFGDVISNALAGEPQRIARRGRDAVIVVSEAEWERMQAPRPAKSFGELLASFPLTHEEWLEVAPGPLPLRSRRRRKAA